MIKILFFIETLKEGGAEKVLCDLVNHMDQKEFDITVQTVWPQDPADYLVPGIRYKSMYAKKNKWTRYRYRIEAAAGFAYAFHIKDDYDIECAYLEMGPTKVMAQSTSKKAVKLAWVHCDLMHAIKNKDAFYEKTAKWYSKYDHIVCVSEQAKKSFDEIFHDRFDSVILHNVVNDELIRTKSLEAAPEYDPDRLNVLTVGRLSREKNFLRLLKAHQRLKAEGLDHDLWIIGEGSEREKLEKYIDENSLRQTAHMPGYRNNPYPYIRNASLLVCSSNYEGYSTFITEGVILGRPIVTTECSGMKEILGDSEFGMITENSDEAFYEGMKRMLEDSSVRESYAARAEKRGADFSTASLVKETEDYLKNILK